jgi:hypothetical protein
VDEITKWTLGSWAGLLSVVVGWLHIDVKGKASKDDLRALMDEIRIDRQAARDDNQAARESRAKLYERVSTMAESLARLEGRLEK